MHILYDDKNAKRSDGSYRLILIAGGWHVVANGYLCRVKDQEEGRQVITDHMDAEQGRRTHTRNSPPPDYRSSH